MYSKFAQFNNKDLVSIQDFDFPFGQGGENEKGHGREIQTGCQEPQGKLSFYIKSSQNIAVNYEISFENSFMNQHQTVFLREFKNYMEYLRQLMTAKKSNELSMFENEFQQQNNKRTCSELLDSSKIKMDKETIENISKMLKNFQKLKTFLDMVSSHCSEQITLQLMILAQKVLQAHNNDADQYMSSYELMQIADSVSAQPESISILNLAFVHLDLSQEISISEKYRKFMKIYCATVILVICQFFENPYNEHDDLDVLKRPLSPFYDEFSNFSDDEENKYEMLPMKKRKTSL